MSLLTNKGRYDTRWQEQQRVKEDDLMSRFMMPKQCKRDFKPLVLRHLHTMGSLTEKELARRLSVRVGSQKFFKMMEDITVLALNKSIGYTGGTYHLLRREHVHVVDDS